MRFEYEFEGIEKTISAIRRGITDGMEESADWLLDAAQDEAQDTIMRKRRVWRHEVYSSFFSDVERESPTKVSGNLTNYAPHAEVVNDGRTPGKEAPQVQHIIEWVDDNINGGWSNSGDDPMSGGGEVDQSRIVNSGGDITVESEPTGFKNTEEIQEEFGLDSTYYVDDPSPSGFRKGNVHVGQKVVVYDEINATYFDGEVTRVTGAGQVEIDDGVVTHTINGGPDGIDDKFIVAGEEWTHLSYENQMDVVSREFQSVPRISSYPDYYKEDLNDVIAEYMAVVDDPTELRTMAQPINKFGTPSDSPANSPYAHATTIDQYLEKLYVAFRLPDDDDPTKRTKGRIKTLRHELGHVYGTSKGWNYMSGARDSSKGWDQTKSYKNRRTVDFNYIEQGGPGNLVRDEDEPVAPPWVYMMLNEEERDNDKYPAYEAWKDHIYEQTVVEARSTQKFNYDPYYDGRPDATFNAGPSPEKGDWVKVFDNKGGVERDTTIEKFERIDPVTRELTVTFDDNGSTETITLNEDGTFDDSRYHYSRYGEKDAGRDDPSVDEDNIAPDPGFQSDTESAIFREGLNRALFRMMITNESGTKEEKAKTFLKRSYAAANGQETLAIFMEIFLERGNSGETDIEDDALDLYERHPDFLWAAHQKFGVPPWLQNRMSTATGKTWPEIVNELENKYG